jgi:hypothetical protein
MLKSIAAASIATLVSLYAFAAGPLTAEQIQQVIDATDAAAMKRDTQGIGKYLSEHFEKIIEVPYQGWTASMKLDKNEYLDLIDQGWENMEKYSYQREATVINIAADGLSGESSSTITETVVIDGETRVSKVREYAQYALENGTAVITTIGGHTLVGDSMPEPSQ